MNECKHKNSFMGSAGGMVTIPQNDGSVRPLMIKFECVDCGRRELSFENPPDGTESEKEILLIAKNFYTSKFRYTKEGNLEEF